jgi:hypothetical protein
VNYLKPFGGRLSGDFPFTPKRSAPCTTICFVSGGRRKAIKISLRNGVRSNAFSQGDTRNPSEPVVSAMHPEDGKGKRLSGKGGYGNMLFMTG